MNSRAETCYNLTRFWPATPPPCPKRGFGEVDDGVGGTSSLVFFIFDQELTSQHPSQPSSLHRRLSDRGSAAPIGVNQGSSITLATQPSILHSRCTCSRGGYSSRLTCIRPRRANSTLCCLVVGLHHPSHPRVGS